jgi:hypothetical protein
MVKVPCRRHGYPERQDAAPVPKLHVLRKFGKPGWVHISEQRRVQGDKLSPRAMRKYFVGREGSWI